MMLTRSGVAKRIGMDAIDLVKDRQLRMLPEPIVFLIDAIVE